MIRIGNCSGFYGDRLSAMREMLTGGELDVLTGDYLAELTMLILGKDQLKDPSLGYARTFVRQLEDALGLALERGVRIVANAGGLNPAGLAAKVGEVASGLGLEVSVAHVEGDDCRALFPEALTANAYLGGFGIAAALGAGADVVVTGRVTDASLVVGPAIWHHGWTPDDLDALAGAVVAGHVVECGAQATGGNFSGFLGTAHGVARQSEAKTDTTTPGLFGKPLGFPIAEVAADGSCVITKHAGTGGAVTLDTVTAQLMYEIQGPRYLGPDVTARLDTIDLSEEGPDRVRVSGVKGEAPPEQIKVCLNELGGWRNSVEFVLTGLDIEAKAELVRTQLEAAWSGGAGVRPADVTWTLGPLPREDADTEAAASTTLRCVVKDPDPTVAGQGFTAPAVEIGLASYPGFTLTGPPTPATPYGIYRAAYVDPTAVTHTVVHGDGSREVIAYPASTTSSAADHPLPGMHEVPEVGTDKPVRRVALGTFVHARSGDKGGDANLGLWVDNSALTRETGDQDSAAREARVAWLLAAVTPEWVRALLPETADLDIVVHPLPNLGGVNIVIHRLLGDGVAASTRFDPQAKGLGEWARSRFVEIPEELW